MSKEFTHELFSVKNKVVVITGGVGILCGAMGLTLAKAGSKVAILDISKEAANAVVEKIRQDRGDAVALFCNALERDSIKAAANQVIQRFQRVDILINGAGGNKAEATTTTDYSFFDIPADAICWVFDLNLVGVLLASQVFGKHMVKQKEGVILNISSMNAYRPLTRIPAIPPRKLLL